VVSRVVHVDRDTEERKEVMEAQKGDTKAVARNRRMFGNLLGTLQKFTKEQKEQKQEQKQKEVLKKVEEKTEREKEDMRNRKRELFEEQKKKKKDIQILQIQLKRTEEFEAWEASKKSEVNFIRTKAEPGPPVYWLPKAHSEKSKGLLAESRATVEKELEEKREAFEQELVQIEKRMTADLERRQQQYRRSDGGEVQEVDRSLEEEKEADTSVGEGFGKGRVVVERREDLAKDDLRMMIRNEKGEEKKEERNGRKVEVKEEEKEEQRKEGRRTVRLEKANGSKDVDMEDKENVKESRKEEKSSAEKKRKEEEEAEGPGSEEDKKGAPARKRQRSKKEESGDSSSEEEERRPRKKRESGSPRKAGKAKKQTKKKPKQESSSSDSD